ncbi:glycosyltransferase family 4 protein [Stutzerimonas stutzeri]|nr:glycosyltransferase family 4 protein [Stutzerimonas stutzeri]MDH0182327.1 glycosyltransferase family 4 protein [Stutzerimonas stutzeri]MDH1246943.1 glycosyltransferase family 4 protein [Stutzerimonas stutzeri]
MFWIALLFALVASFSLTAVMRAYALRRSLIDVPNGRSSHSVPTPRGGGVSIVAVTILSLLALGAKGCVDTSLALALVGAGSAVAVLGFADDHGHIAARWRLAGHFIASAWALFFLGGVPALTFFGAAVSLGWVGNLAAVVFVVWLLNLYNFMDGIDGIASIEALCVCLGALICYAAAGEMGGELGRPEVFLAMAVAGFVCWNFPRAHIFMGDAGSGFLGVTIAVLAIAAAWWEPQLFWSWLILLGVFIVDATFTLLRRLLRGEAVYQAHRSHAYQYAARRWKRHWPVTIAVAVINLLWLTPVAAWVATGLVDGATAMVVAYLPLLVLAWWLGAGKAES